MLFISLQPKQKNARLAVILHGDTTTSKNMNDVLQIVFALRQKLISGVAKLAVRFLEKADEFDSLMETGGEEITKLANGITVNFILFCLNE